ncbi:hypothetical protein HBI56_196430 [Parastagonospora nodorum]|nr:hypothetical protein HBH47_191610 [Parastagonospora nodorum]KAH4201654.1 hypothetical protein HBH42_032950 [Parastagonospora nodorum]KAH4913365.1 hypothetical protein HBH74_164270 [Parastagonospora nodorum]KAH4926963.1 hypothetical protein HBH73_203270 [Parastagonospora nodorum]KAH5077022.1 hypothetical protein HBI73_175880 [Parastagonospora nodorum]
MRFARTRTARTHSTRPGVDRSSGMQLRDLFVRRVQVLGLMTVGGGGAEGKLLEHTTHTYPGTWCDLSLSIHRHHPTSTSFDFRRMCLCVRVDVLCVVRKKNSNSSRAGRIVACKRPIPCYRDAGVSKSAAYRLDGCVGLADASLAPGRREGRQLRR